MLMNQVPNLNHYPIDPNDQRFGFLPFVGGLAVGALAGGFNKPRPCGPMCHPMWMTPQFIPIPIQTLPAPIPIQSLPAQVFPQHQFQPIQPLQTVQGPLLESNQFYIQ